MKYASLLIGLWLAAPMHAGTPKRPNVIIILTDDQRADCLSIAGHPHLKTPNIDRLGKEGVYFKNAFCTTSLCSPSRASILSGVYAHRHGVVNNFTDFPNIPSLHGQLQKAGYLTAYIGKWHMGEDDDSPRRGWKHWVSHKGQGKYFDNEFNINGTREVKKGYYTHVVTDLALDFLKSRNKDQPFFLMMGHKAPHSFYVPEPKYEKAFDNVPVKYPASAFKLDNKPGWIKERQTTWHGIYGPLFEFRKKFPDASPEAEKDFTNMIRSYWGTILSVDDSVGRILAELENLGILDDTIVVFAGDNGLLNGEHGMVDKRTMHDPSIRVPLLVRYPGLTPKNQPRLLDSVVRHVDLAPSILDLCGADPLPDIQGDSWRRLLRRESQHWNSDLYYEYNYEKQFPYTPNVRGLRTGRWAYMHYPHGDGSPDRHKAELYDMSVDPDQLKNLIDDLAYARQVAMMRKGLRAAQERLGIKEDKMPIDEGIKQTLPDFKIR